MRGDWEKCIEYDNQAIEIARPMGNIPIIYMSMVHVGLARFMLGESGSKDREEGLALMEESLERMEASKVYILYSVLYGDLAYCYARAGRVEEAIEAANKCLKWIPKGTKLIESWGYRALAMAMAQTALSDPQQVDQTMKKALLLNQEREEHPDLAWGYFEYARILFERGDQKKGQDYLNQSIELFTEMKMTWWLEQARELEECFCNDG